MESVGTAMSQSQPQLCLGAAAGDYLRRKMMTLIDKKAYGLFGELGRLSLGVAILGAVFIIRWAACHLFGHQAAGATLMEREMFFVVCALLLCC